MKERLHKYLSRCGLGSRRKCEEIIKRGEISVNCVTISNMGFSIDPEIDSVYFRDKRVYPQDFVYWALYKPTNVVCSCKPDKKYKRVIDFLPESDYRLYPVGRLDADSEGLIIITNDGTLCNKVTHPKFGVDKEYQVKINSTLSSEEIKQIESGIIIDDNYLAKPKIKETVNSLKSCTINLILNEGKNREIRKIFGAIEKRVILLKRLRIGPVELGKLKEGEYRLLNKDEINKLKNTIAKETQK